MEFLLLALSVSILIFPYVYVKKNIANYGTINLIKPIHYFLITSSLFFPIKAMILFAGVKQSHFLFYNNYLNVEIVVETIFYVLIHVCFVIIGYQYYIKFIGKQSTVKSYFLPSESRINLIILLYIILGVLAIADRIKTGTFFFIKDYDESKLEHYFWWYVPVLFGFVGSSFYLYGVTPFLAFAAGYYKKKKYVVLYYVFSAIYIFIGLYSGQKEVIYSIIIIYLFYSFSFRRKTGTPLKSEVMKLVPVLLFVLFLPNLNYYRLLLVESTSRVGTHNLILAMKTKQESNYIFKRIDHLDASYNVIKKTPDVVPFKYGETYLKSVDALTIYLPFLRAYYPYTETINNSFANEYNLINESVSGITLPIFVEAYMNFGIAGIILISILYGLLIGKITFLLDSPLFHIKLIGFILFYIFLIQFNALSFQAVSIAISRELFTILIIYFFLKGSYSTIS
ncbi:MAG: O-antigen polymerase [Bacteroidales bacterium]